MTAFTKLSTFVFQPITNYILEEHEDWNVRTNSLH